MNSAEPISGNHRIFRAESCLVPHNQKEKQKEETPYIHSTPGGDATLRPLFFTRLVHILCAERRTVTNLQHIILLGLRGFCIGALVSAIVACLVTRPALNVQTQDNPSKRDTAKACYHYSSDGKQRCV